MPRGAGRRAKRPNGNGKDADYQPAAGDVEERLTIPQGCVGKVIGQRGKMIKTVQATAKASVQIIETPGEDPVVLLRGTATAVADAKQIILPLVGADLDSTVASFTSVDSSAAGSPARETPNGRDSPPPKKASRERRSPKKDSNGASNDSVAAADAADNTLADAARVVRSAVAHPYAVPVATAGGGAAGGLTGLGVGALVGVPAAFFTFGLSIPFCAAGGGLFGSVAGCMTGHITARVVQTVMAPA